MPAFLVVAFFVTALLYACVGFGGGSTYNALLVMHGTDYRVLPAIALICNIIVVAGGVWRFSSTGDLSVQRLLPFLVTSVPAAWIGGRLPIGESVFTGLLGGALLVSALLLLGQRTAETAASATGARMNWVVSSSIGAGIGFLAGLVGIGGGIFLAPVLYFRKWGTARQIAAAASLFILTNSMSGLAGQMAKLQDLSLLSLVTPYWPLPLAVLVGGQLGSWLSSARLNAAAIRFLTALLMLYVAVQLLHKGYTMSGWGS